MPGQDHGNSIKKPRVYEALRRKGYSKRSAARISNAQAQVASKGRVSKGKGGGRRRGRR